MTSITGNAVLDGLSNVGKAAAKGSSKLDQNSFLKLMTTQLKTQDPFAPVDNQEMIAQMAQFSSVAGISEMNASLKEVAADMKAARMGDAASWIGRSALVASDTATPLRDGGYAGQIVLPEAASAVSLSLIDEAGGTVHSQDLGAAEAGPINWAWDGKGADGKPGATGPLKLVVAASNTTANGFLSDVATASWTAIAGVQSPAGGSAAQLVTGLGLISPADAQRLS